MPEALLVNNTAGASTTVTGSDVNLITGTVKPNMYNYVRVTSRVEVTTTGTSATTNNTLKIKLGTTTLGTFIFKTDVGARTIPLNLEYIGDLSAGGTLAVTVAGAGVDANTSFIARNLYCTSIQ